MLTCHAHVDHAGGHAYLKKLSSAQVVMLYDEVDLLQSGGKADFSYGSVPEFCESGNGESKKVSCER